MAAYAYNAINSLGVESLGEVHAPDPGAAREQLRVRGLLATRLHELPSAGEESARTVFKKIKPKSLQIFSRQFATMIEAGAERRQRARHPRAADGRQVPRRHHPGAPRRRRGRHAAVPGDVPASEGLRPPLRLDGRGGRGGRHPRHGARPRRLPDREVDRDQAPRQGRDDLPDDGADLRQPRPRRHAALPRPGLRRHLRPARRRPADADAVGAERVQLHQGDVVHPVPGHRSRRSSGSRSFSRPIPVAGVGTGSS